MEEDAYNVEQYDTIITWLRSYDTIDGRIAGNVRVEMGGTIDGAYYLDSWHADIENYPSYKQGFVVADTPEELAPRVLALGYVRWTNWVAPRQHKQEAA